MKKKKERKNWRRKKEETSKVAAIPEHLFPFFGSWNL
jgi:hypothetical protein